MADVVIRPSVRGGDIPEVVQYAGWESGDVLRDGNIPERAGDEPLGWCSS